MRHLHAASTQKHATPPATRGNLIRWARYYDLTVDLLTLGQRGRLRGNTMALAHIRPGEPVLEVGCGTGDLAILAARQSGPGGRVVGIDPAPEMIDVARAKAQRAGAAVDFQSGVIEALPFPDASFAVVLSSMMMHHLPDDLKRAGLGEIMRVLQPGGRLLIVDALRPEGHLGQAINQILLHGALTTGVQDLPAMLQSAGFTAIETSRLGIGTPGVGNLGAVQARRPA